MFDMYHLVKNWKVPGVKFSPFWVLFWPRILFWDADIVGLALCDDVDAMRGLFSMGFSHPFDVLPGGVTFLHVCFSTLPPKSLIILKRSSFSPRRRQG
jgi:hypothetical protein